MHFCDSRSPWERGSNEKTNGLLHAYFPKGVTSLTIRWSTCWQSRTNSTNAPEWSSKAVALPIYSPPCWRQASVGVATLTGTHPVATGRECDRPQHRRIVGRPTLQDREMRCPYVHLRNWAAPLNPSVDRLELSAPPNGAEPRQMS